MNYICEVKDFSSRYKNGQILGVTITNGQAKFKTEKGVLTMPPDLIISSYKPDGEIIFRNRSFGIYRTKDQLTKRVLHCISKADENLFMSLMAVLSLDDLILFLARQRKLDIQGIEKQYTTLNKIKALALGSRYDNEKKVAFSKAISLSMTIAGISKEVN